MSAAVRPRPRAAARLTGGAARLRESVLLHAGVIALAAGLWALALTATDPSGVSGYGLLAALPPTYYVALVLLTCGFAAAAAGERTRSAVLGAYVLGLAVALHATTAILYPEPRYAWTYKHLGVIDYLTSHGHASRAIDIYQNWPGFFALNGWLSRTAGISPLHYAAWAQLFFELAMVGAVVFALRGVTRDTRIQWTAAWFFLVANWLGQDYLAPQAFAFLLSVVVLGLALRCSAWARPPRTRAGWAVVRVVNRVWTAVRRGRTPRISERGDTAMSARAALAIGAVCSVAVIVSHQLTPVLLIFGMATLALATRRPPLWVVAGLVALEAWWLWLGSDFVLRHFKLLEFNPGANPRGGYGGAHALPGVSLGADLSHAGMVVVVLIALAGVVRRLRAGYWDAAAAILIAFPPLIALLQSYGGEAPLRVYLFTLPWLAFFVAVACRPGREATSTLRRSWRLVAVTVVVGATTLFGYFGQEPLNYMTKDDVAAARWFIDSARDGSTLTNVFPNLPERSDANYARFLDDTRSLSDSAAFRAHVRANPALAVRDARAFMRAGSGRSRYLIVTPSQERYARYHGLTGTAGFDRLAKALYASPDFTVAYRHGDAVVLRFTPAPARTASRGRSRGAA